MQMSNHWHGEKERSLAKGIWTGVYASKLPAHDTPGNPGSESVDYEAARARGVDKRSNVTGMGKKSPARWVNLHNEEISAALASLPVTNDNDKRPRRHKLFHL